MSRYRDSDSSRTSGSRAPQHWPSLSTPSRRAARHGHRLRIAKRPTSKLACPGGVQVGRTGTYLAHTFIAPTHVDWLSCPSSQTPLLRGRGAHPATPLRNLNRAGWRPRPQQGGALVHRGKAGRARCRVHAPNHLSRHGRPGRSSLNRLYTVGNGSIHRYDRGLGFIAAPEAKGVIFTT